MHNSAQMIKGQLWVHFEGRTFLYDTTTEKKFGKKSQRKNQSGSIASPMPGKITKILKQKGDLVASGEAILVMEAMKMEYTLKADIGGTLLEVACKVGDQVALGKVLAQIKEEK